MDFLPLFHHLQGRTVLVVGGGDVALRKARLLHSAGACLRVVSPQVHDALRPLAADLHQRTYREADLYGVALVVAATDNGPLNAAVSSQAQARGIPVNVVDFPGLCSVIFPAIVDRSPLMVAVSSGGHAPVLARLVRAKIETWLPACYGQLAGLARRFRSHLKARLPGTQQRRVFWEDTFQGPIAEAMFAGRPEQAHRLLEAKLAAAKPQALGEVYCVGAGPGDPDLLTFRALRLMQQADVVLHDPSLPPAIIDLCRRDADRIALGPPPGTAGSVAACDDAFLSSDTAASSPLAATGDTAAGHHKKVVNLAQQGQRVLLLAAGESPTRGRDALLRTLAAQGIPFQVVPGIRPSP